MSDRDRNGRNLIAKTRQSDLLRFIRHIARLWAQCMLLWVCAAAATAHPQYVTLPSKTVTDRLETSAIIVLARPPSATAWHYEPEVWLKGDQDTELPAIPHLVDSAARRSFNRNPEDAVVFAYHPDRMEWDRVVYANSQVLAMVLDILGRLPDWDEGRDDTDRFAFFAERQAHPDPTIRHIALIELAQARYSLIRTMEPQFSRSEIEAVLRDPYKIPLVPLFTVMLGLLNDDSVTTLVREKIEKVDRLELNFDLTAWGTALIEIDEGAAVERLAEIVLRMGRNSQTRKTADSAMTALALHGTEGHVVLRDRIAAVLSEAADIDAQFAASAASTLVEWKDWRLAPRAEEYLSGAAPIALRERLALTGYLALAQQADDPSTAND